MATRRMVVVVVFMTGSPRGGDLAGRGLAPPSAAGPSRTSGDRAASRAGVLRSAAVALPAGPRRPTRAGRAARMGHTLQRTPPWGAVYGAGHSSATPAGRSPARADRPPEPPSKAVRPQPWATLRCAPALLRTTVEPASTRAAHHPEEHTMTTYQPTLSAALAHEHVTELLRQAATSRAAAQAPTQNPHRTPRRRPAVVGPPHRPAGHPSHRVVPGHQHGQEP